MVSSFTLASDLHKIGLQIPDIGELSITMSQVNKEANQNLPQSLRECKVVLEISNENQVSTNHTDTFKNIKQEVDKYLVESIQNRRELRQLLQKYTNNKSTTDSQHDKISNVMAKLNLSMCQYQRYITLLEKELIDFCGTRHRYLLSLSKHILNLQHLVHFGRKIESSPDSSKSLSSSTSFTLTNNNNNNNKLEQSPSNSSNRLIAVPTNFKEIVNHPVFLKAFTMFAEKQHGLENLLFWVDADALKKLEEGPTANKDAVRSHFFNLYNNYIVEGSTLEVNIDAESRNAIETRRASLFTDDHFHPCLASAIDNIECLLNYSMVPHFFKSTLYNAAAAVMLNKSTPFPVEAEGITHIVESLDSLITNPIGLEHFLVYLSRGATTQVSMNNPTLTTSTATPGTGTQSSQSPPLSSSPSGMPASPRTMAALLSPYSISFSEARNMVLFYLEIKKFYELSDEYLELYATDLFRAFLTPGAEKELSTFIPTHYNTTQQMIASKTVTRDIFQPVLQEIVLHLTNTHFPAFVHSPVCKEMLYREDKMIKYQEKDKRKPDAKMDQQFELLSKEKLKAPAPTPSGTVRPQASFKPAAGLAPMQEKSRSTQHFKELPPVPAGAKPESPVVRSLPNLPPIPVPTPPSRKVVVNDYILATSTPNPMPFYSSGSSGSLSSSPLNTSAVQKPNDVFCTILSDSTWLDSFKRFLKSEKCEEVLLCWMELDLYCRVNSTAKLTMAGAQNIYDNFFQDGSPLEVNIEPEIKLEVREALRAKNMDDVEQGIRSSWQATFELLRIDSFGRFQKSAIYREVLGQMGDPSDPKNTGKKKSSSSSSSKK
ncbi:hypothetical protein SAMD00019534_061650 [Acytostelium subglobosum LB1]|uniref:hypothetical protein n=1 Tax=Acytostelium subglobosum LB1 TaxID=1410327 RepID=UPI000644A241|nr:hypothetical protein SAMD00019534_061650 [Acytostelium subglobosum LB1]GAM22990.1 hypothetical protein SAMD00019534_061650 [Acytostelium subglobosum LB1]|eukprot:XP_012754217.1 hypothetical protein SAMD00019534_061650 [Acytostelium subglobosum LB1]